jgi:hypothetical protein
MTVTPTLTRFRHQILAAVLASAILTILTTSQAVAHVTWHLSTHHYYHSGIWHYARGHMNDGTTSGPSTYGYVRIYAFNTNDGYSHGSQAVMCEGGCGEQFTAYLQVTKGGHSHTFNIFSCGIDSDGHISPDNVPSFDDCQGDGSNGPYATSGSHPAHS